jgi:arylsulfatase A
MLHLALVLLSLGPALGQEVADHAPLVSASRRPNIVLILADDLGAGELGAYGQKKIRTPHLDRLAREGMRFEAAYSGSPVCAPSRCVLLTGRHSGHAIVRDNSEVGGWGPSEPEGQLALPAAEVTIAEHLRAAGYVTAAGGKWGLGGPGSEGQPSLQGFDHFIGYLCQRVAHNYHPTHLWRDGERLVLEGNEEWFSAHQELAEPLASDGDYYALTTRPQYAPDVIVDDLVAWTRAHATRDESDAPFFLYYASLIPHVALQIPRAEVEAYPADWDTAPYLGQHSYLPHPSPRRAYAAMITRLDTEVGRILAVLDEAGVADDTLVIFTSDNGASWVGGVDTEFFGSHDGRRGRKAQLYEGGIRVPMIVRWPGHVAPGSVCSAPVAFQDLFPTLAAAACAPVTDEALAQRLDGLDLAPTLADPRVAPARDALYFEFKPFGGQAVRKGDWKLLRRVQGRELRVTLELYDLRADPTESKNLAEARPEVVSDLLAIMAREHTPSPHFPLPGMDDSSPNPPEKR